MAVPGTVPSTSRPRVVLFRANGMDADSRAKKLSLTLARLGYEVFALSAEREGSPVPVRVLGESDGPQVTVLPVVVKHTYRDVHTHLVAARRRRQLRVLDWTPGDEYHTQVRELRRDARAARRKMAAAWQLPEEPRVERTDRIDRTDRAGQARQAEQAAEPGPRRPVRGTYWALRYLLADARLGLRNLRWQTQRTLTVGHRLAWRRWDDHRVRHTALTTTRGTLPELEDYAAAFAPVLDSLAPDIIHAHHPLVLGIAVRAARRRRAMGQPCRVVYDAREDFLGIPKQEQGHWRRHSALVREEARSIGAVDAVLTVSEPITETLASRYALAARPTPVLNVPVDDVRARPGAVTGPTVRDAAGLADGVPLLVYGGAVSRARGLDVLVDALAHLPGVHAAVVAVPHPHPMVPELTARARELGVADRLHLCPPVDQDRLLHYLSGADVAVMPLRTGSANIEQALPNKLFENLHAGLTMVTSDARLMAEFVRRHDLGEVFSFDGPRGGAEDLAAAVTRALANPRDPASPRWEELRRTYSWQGQEPAVRQAYAALVEPPCPDGIDDRDFPSLTLRPLPLATTTLPAGRAGPRSGAGASGPDTVGTPASLEMREVVEDRTP